MFLYLSKLAPIFVFPLGLAILLLLVGFFAPRRLRLGRVLSLAGILLLVIFSSGVTSGILMRSLEDQYPELPVNAVPPAQAIVVLGGMLRCPAPAHPSVELAEGSDRLLEAFRLYRAGKAPVILISGGNVPFLGGRTRMPEAQAASLLLQEWGVPARAILVEDSSLNTRENAVHSYRFLSERNMRQILLVTSAAHMPRAAAVFRKAGFDLTPVPADFATGWGEPDALFRWLPDAGALSQSQGALKEWLGLLVYRLRGWA